MLVKYGRRLRPAEPVKNFLKRIEYFPFIFHLDTSSLTHVRSFSGKFEGYYYSISFKPEHLDISMIKAIRRRIYYSYLGWFYFIIDSKLSVINYVNYH